MKSEIWDKKNDIKGFTVGYSIEQIELFENECEEFLNLVLRMSSYNNDQFQESENDLKKANWMILNEITSALLDCLEMLKKDNIRMASRVYRDVMENMHILELINKSENGNHLIKWYENEVISHRKYRDWLKRQDEELSELTRDVYRIYSKFAHRTFEPIFESYDLNDDKTIRFKTTLDRKNQSDLKLLSKYYNFLTYFVLNTTFNYADYNVLDSVRMSVIAEKATE